MFFPILYSTILTPMKRLYLKTLGSPEGEKKSKKLVSRTSGVQRLRLFTIIGTLKRKVYVKFEGIDKELSCPLDYLRVRLIRRFGTEKR